MFSGELQEAVTKGEARVHSKHDFGRQPLKAFLSDYSIALWQSFPR